MRYLIAFTLSLTAALAGCVDPNSLANGNGDLAIDDLAFFDCPPDTCDDMSKAFPPACSDNMKDGDETDVDCGGSCPACAAGKSCAKGKDCQSTFCTNTLCAAASCMDGAKNGTETDVDCGGSCPGCALGKACTFATDCASMTCTNGACAPSPCTNGIKDGMETDIDCGGPVCSPCADNKACLIGADCTGGICTNQLCKSPIQCMAPMANCDNNPMSGCNINLNTDAKNCGKCGMVCPMNAPSCAQGKCVSSALPPMDNSLVAYWNLDDPGPVAKDLSGNGNNGTVRGATQVPGKVGKAYAFSNGQCITMPLSQSLQMTGSQSVTQMAWINAAGACNSDDVGVIVSKDGAYEMSLRCANDAFLSIFVGQAINWSGAEIISFGSWHLVASTWDGATMQQFVDGVLVESYPIAGQLAASNFGVGIGCFHVPPDGSAVGGGFFNGTIDEVTIYKRVLSANEIMTYYQASK